VKETMLDPNIDTPKDYQEFVTRVGGKNPYGKPMWRVVLAQRCLRRSSGLLHSLPSGDVSVFDVDAKGKVHYQQPEDTVKSGEFYLPRYNAEGWIAERWFPASAWGTPEEWGQHKGEAGERLFHEPYPVQGDYFMLIGPFEKLPEHSDIENALRMFEHEHDKRPTDFKKHFAQVLRDEETAREKRREKLEQDLMYMRKNELVPVLKSGSLEAQRYRNELNASIGDRSHLGAVHDA
jgi:hypothetical protein